MMLEPLIGEKLANGWLGKVVDILGVFATVAGVVTSLGLGTLQINAGFNYLFGVPINLVILDPQYPGWIKELRLFLIQTFMLQSDFWQYAL